MASTSAPARTNITRCRANSQKSIKTDESDIAARAVGATGSGGTLNSAVEGWEKERARPSGTVHEYKRAIEMFIQLHGDLPLAEIKKSHVGSFREALQ
jgi:hypothetical protein